MPAQTCASMDLAVTSQQQPTQDPGHGAFPPQPVPGAYHETPKKKTAVSAHETPDSRVKGKITLTMDWSDPSNPQLMGHAIADVTPSHVFHWDKMPGVKEALINFVQRNQLYAEHMSKYLSINVALASLDYTELLEDLGVSGLASVPNVTGVNVEELFLNRLRQKLSRIHKQHFRPKPAINTPSRQTFKQPHALDTDLPISLPAEPASDSSFSFGHKDVEAEAMVQGGPGKQLAEGDEPASKDWWTNSFMFSHDFRAPDKMDNESRPVSPTANNPDDPDALRRKPAHGNLREIDSRQQSLSAVQQCLMQHLARADTTQSIPAAGEKHQSQQDALQDDRILYLKAYAAELDTREEVLALEQEEMAQREKSAMALESVLCERDAGASQLEQELRGKEARLTAWEHDIWRKVHQHRMGKVQDKEAPSSTLPIMDHHECDARQAKQAEVIKKLTEKLEQLQTITREKTVIDTDDKPKHPMKRAEEEIAAGDATKESKQRPASEHRRVSFKDSRAKSKDKARDRLAELPPNVKWALALWQKGVFVRAEDADIIRGVSTKTLDS